ncbi:MAG: outer membrane protein assembly factor BamB [Planctomycetota bacterium]|jgi:outer membrane protein assembly factor BamB
MRLTAPALALCLCSALQAQTAPAQAEWGQFRGPGGSGIYAGEEFLPTEFSPGKNERWSAEVPAGHSSPVVAGGRVLLTGHTSGRLETLCLDLESGSLLWRRSIASGAAQTRLHRTNSPASATPVCDGERVVAYFASFGLVAYDMLGQESWRRPLPTPGNTFGTSSSPILSNGRLLFLHDVRGGSYLEAMDPATGEVLWHQERADIGPGWSTPSVRHLEERSEVLAYGPGWLSAYDLQDGRPLWTVPGLTDEPIVIPGAADGLVFVTSYNMNVNTEVERLPKFDDLLAELDTDGNGSLTPEETEPNTSILSRHDADGEGDHPLRMFFRFLDENKNGELEAGEYPKVIEWLADMKFANALLALRTNVEGSSVEIAWQWNRGVPECPSPILVGEHIILVKNGGIVTCLRRSDGELVYEGRLDQRGPMYASPVAGDGKLYTCSARGQVTVFGQGDSLNVLARNDIGERIMATPALAGGSVLIRTTTRLYAFGD